MTWINKPIPNDEEGRPMFEGLIELINDKNEKLGSICWFYDSGPFYAHAMDINDITLIRRIGPCTTLDSAKEAIDKALSGLLNISNRAGYSRDV